MITNNEDRGGKGKDKGSMGYVYFILDRKTGQWGIYRYISRLCHEFDIDYRKLSAGGFVNTEFYDDGRYLVAGSALEIKGLGTKFHRYDTAIRTLYNNAAMASVKRHRLEDIKKNRFRREDDKISKRCTRHYYKR